MSGLPLCSVTRHYSQVVTATDSNNAICSSLRAQVQILLVSSFLIYPRASSYDPTLRDQIQGMSLPLSPLFARCISNASKASVAPVVQESTQVHISFCNSSSCLALIIPLQDLVKATLTDLTTLSSRIQSLSLFSPNDALEDISTKDLIYLLVPFVSAEVKGRLKTVDREERISVLRETQVQSNMFAATRK